MENSFPEPVDLFHVLTSPLLVTLALIVHLFWYGVMLAIGVTTGPLPPVAGLGCKTEVRTGGTDDALGVGNTDALGVGALGGGPPPIGSDL